jgi:SPP1 family predicted phage head-tail adaptor
MQINPGELNKKISIYSKSNGIDSGGFPTNTETLVLSCWAKITRTSGTEIIKANADFADVKIRFLIRYPKAAITREMIVRYGVDYEIEYVNDYGDAHEYVEIVASRMTAEVA